MAYNQRGRGGHPRPNDPRHLGAMVGQSKTGRTAGRSHYQRRLDTIAARAGRRGGPRPVVYFEEWDAPMHLGPSPGCRS